MYKKQCELHISSKHLGTCQNPCPVAYHSAAHISAAGIAPLACTWATVKSIPPGHYHRAATNSHGFNWFNMFQGGVIPISGIYLLIRCSGTSTSDRSDWSDWRFGDGFTMVILTRARCHSPAHYIRYPERDHDGPSIKGVLSPSSYYVPFARKMKQLTGLPWISSIQNA